MRWILGSCVVVVCAAALAVGAWTAVSGQEGGARATTARPTSGARRALTAEAKSGANAAAARGAAGGSPVVRISRAVVIAIEDIHVPAKQAGELAELHVEEGAVVEQGSLLAQVDDSVAKAKKATAEAELRIAKAQAESDAKVKAADAVARYQEAEYQVNEELFRRNVVSNTELRKFKVQFERSVAETEVARLEDHVADLTQEGKQAILDQSTIELGNFQVVARLKESGKAKVVEIEKHVGDWVQLGESILRLVRMDEVRVQGYVNVGEYSPREIVDQPVTIEVTETIGGRKVTETVDARIHYVSDVIEPSGDYRVWAKVKNPQVGERDWLLRPGSSVAMVIQVKDVAK